MEYAYIRSREHIVILEVCDGKQGKGEQGGESCPAFHQEEKMGTCPRCKRTVRFPEGEEDDHSCPYCGYDPAREEAEQDEIEDRANDYD